MWFKRLLNLLVERLVGKTPYPELRSPHRETLVREANHPYINGKPFNL